MDPTPDELRSAAAKRTANTEPVQYGASVSKRMAYTRSAQPVRSAVHSEKLPVVRITPDMALSIADFGNANQLNTSDSVRSLIALGLDTWKATSDE